VRLNLTRQADHALRAMAWMTGQPRGARRKAAEIAGAAGIPLPYAARILARLQREGLLDARAGHDGGYALVRSPADVTLLEVIEAIEGPLRSSSCLLRDGRCGGGGYCALHHAWSSAQSALREALADTSLADSVAQGRAPAHAVA
jgi:Rrf2 family iron-sulfur cluster assembly transcriptional regulator